MPAGFVGGGDAVEGFAGEERVQACAGAQAVFGGADFGEVTGLCYARGDLGGAFRGRGQREVGGGDGRDVDLQIDAVEQRAGDTALIRQLAPRRFSAMPFSRAPMSTATSVRCLSNSRNFLITQGFPPAGGRSLEVVSWPPSADT